MSSSQAPASPGKRPWLPCLQWLALYDRRCAWQDGSAALVVTLMLIPQSLAYAALAGLPPISGLYASILPLIAYALFGSSRTLAVGPVAIIALMTASALGPLFEPGSQAYMAAASLLALVSGAIMLVMAALRLGFIANFLSHPVISGFIAASAILIALGQAVVMLGFSAPGDTLPSLLPHLWQGVQQPHLPSLLLGLAVLLLLVLGSRYLPGWLQHAGLAPTRARNLGRILPILVIALSAVAVQVYDLHEQGLRVIGRLPEGLAMPALPSLDPGLIRTLFPAALLIALVGFVESVSIGQTLAAKRRQRIAPNQELVGLGAANLASALSAGFPVTGGLSRSVVNFDAGAQTPLAGVFSALAIAAFVTWLTPALQYLPQVALSASILLAVLKLVDLRALLQTWRYSRQDGMAYAVTFAGVLLHGVETGILLGILLSLGLFLWRTSRPHLAVVGQLPGSQHFRNVERFDVITHPAILSLRIDESLYFPNVRYLEGRIAALVNRHPHIRHLVLMCSGVNLIDASALDSLEVINQRLASSGIQLHLSEVKGPVMDRLERSTFFKDFRGQVFISQFDALSSLDPHTHLRQESNPMKSALDLVNQAKASIRELAVEDSEALLTHPHLLIDVREADEFQAGHLPGALNIPRGLLEFKLADQDRFADREQCLILYCKTGGRAALAAQSLQAMGYRQVYSLRGGIEAWNAAQKPIESPSLPPFD